ncbi:ABC transporter substrate-binding protein [Rhizobium sp. P32RR-XVIII]|uniref:ABC transporter substrate-binding protein n=1 Tax=Rhizobium sp. P32RR-XVIII TaxID=2726738 RepID=UPI001456858B|nr:ABC transporter substrate-binding protein [Rhizobium sp. P32RR-XVIII]NLS03956.1 ABC transporter substrate-binding protein [Rhizobium sp. P32RR-XVIII]
MMVSKMTVRSRLWAIAGSLAAVFTMTPAQAQEAWKHGIVEAKGDSGFLFQAAEGGFGQKHNLNIDMVEFTGGPTALKALIAGELDSFEASPVVAFAAMHQNADIKIIGCNWPGMTYTVFAAQDVNSAADLKGKSIGVSAPGSLPALFGQLALEAAGVTDVTYANAGGSADRVRAISSGVVAAAASSSEFAVSADTLKVKPLLAGAEVTPKFVKVCIMTTGAKIAERRADMVNFLAAEMEGLTYAVNNKDAMIALARKVAHLPDDDKTAEFIYDEAIKYKAVATDLAIPMENLQWTDDQMVRLGALKQKADVSKFVDESVRQEALAAVQKK